VPEITTLSDGSLTRQVVVEGEVVDPPQASEVYEAICLAVKHGAKTVEVDLTGVDLFGSAGINALLKVRHVAERLGCTVIVVGASRLVRRVFEVTNLTELLVIDEG